MKAWDIVGWTNGTGCAFCTECEPDDCDEKTPIFASDERPRMTCDVCGQRLDDDETEDECSFHANGGEGRCNYCENDCED